MHAAFDVRWEGSLTAASTGGNIFSAVFVGLVNGTNCLTYLSLELSGFGNLHLRVHGEGARCTLPIDTGPLLPSLELNAWTHIDLSVHLTPPGNQPSNISTASVKVGSSKEISREFPRFFGVAIPIVHIGHAEFGAVSLGGRTLWFDNFAVSTMP